MRWEKCFFLVCGEMCLKFLGIVIFVNLYSVMVYIFFGIVFLVEFFVYFVLLGILIFMFRDLCDF